MREKLIENSDFSVGIFGMIIAINGYFIIEPVMILILMVLSKGVEVLIAHSLLPLVAIFVEPAKVLFLNNALNHGIFTPIGSAQAEEIIRAKQGMILFQDKSVALCCALLDTKPHRSLHCDLASWQQRRNGDYYDLYSDI